MTVVIVMGCPLRFVHEHGRFAISRRIIPVWFVVTLCSCATMPQIEPLELTTDQQHSLPSLYGPDGLLPPEATKMLVDRLEDENRTTGLLRAQLTVAAALPGNPPLFIGNQARLLVDGPATFEAIMEAVGKARDTVNLDSYIFADDTMGRRFASILVQKQLDGVQVNVIYDGVGSLTTPNEFFQCMRHAGIYVVEFNPLDPLKSGVDWKPKNRDHRKLLIVDGKTVFTGGVNVSDVYVSRSFANPSHKPMPPWRDTEVELTGPVARSFQQLFLSTWNRQGGPPLTNHDYFPHVVVTGDQLAYAIGSEAGAEPNPVYFTLVSVIRNAKRSVHITAAYFAPDPRLLGVLTDAARRGVDVTLVLPSVTDVWPVTYTGRSHYHDLLVAGVKIYERQNVLLHAKTAVIDGVWSTIGSTNLDWRSLSLNAEVNAVIVGRDFANQMEALFGSDLRQSRRITLDQWQHRPLTERIKEWFGMIVDRFM
jgi:cardiolipin synthase